MLRFRARVRGARTVLAVSGGLDLPAELGSSATDLDAGLGSGRLARGRKLGVLAPVGVPPRTDAGALADAIAAVMAAYEDPLRLRFVPEEDPDVPPPALDLFSASSFRVSDRSNRTGYRLVGPPLPVRPRPDRLSEPIAPGTIQLPPDGQPIVLLADRQTTGGYPVLGYLVSADRPKAAQLWPGDEIRFIPTSLDEARAAACARQTALERL